MYNWLLIGHIISFVAWMAALFYLPRLFVYHVSAPTGSLQSDTFKIMERRLLKAIMTPAMISTWVFGIWLAIIGSHYTEGWFHLKLLLVIIMTTFHGLCARWRKDFNQEKNIKSAKFFRAVNEIPTILMVAIVILVIQKPI